MAVAFAPVESRLPVGSAPVDTTFTTEEGGPAWYDPALLVVDPVDFWMVGQVDSLPEGNRRLGCKVDAEPNRNAMAPTKARSRSVHI
jgi:hypothetical protein